MTESTARIRRGGKHFEILVDLEEAIKVSKDTGDISQALLTDYIFYNLKSGEQASKDDLIINFETSDIHEVAKKIIKNGTIEKPIQFIKEEQDKKYKQIIDFLSKNATNPEGRPYTADRISTALKEARIDVKNKPIDSQINEIIDKLSKILPIKIDKKKVRLKVPVIYTGKVYGILKEYITSENWENNGDLTCIVEVPSGLIMNFYDSINNMTHGSILSEEIK